VDAKQKPVCPYCGSDNVVVDATARWDVALQEWVLSGVHDSGGCEQCGEETKSFEWENVDGDV